MVILPLLLLASDHSLHRLRGLRRPAHAQERDGGASRRLLRGAHERTRDQEVSGDGGVREGLGREGGRQGEAHARQGEAHARQGEPLRVQARVGDQRVAFYFLMHVLLL